jgi:DNA adenine methylase
MNSRELFEDIKAQHTTRGQTDIQRAARFLLLIKLSYGNDRRSFGCSSRKLEPSIEFLADVKKRLERVVIENKDFEPLVRTYDRPNALFYCDPPYYHAESFYDAIFTNKDHERLRGVLGKIEGHFILSYNDCDDIRELYKGFTIEDVSRQNNLTGRYLNAEKKYHELIIKNY